MSEGYPGEPPEDLGTGIPPINGMSMLDRIYRGEILKTDGIAFSDLKPGQVYTYPYSQGQWRLTILPGTFHSRTKTPDDYLYPLVAVEHLNLEGEDIEGVGGLLVGVDVCGDGNLPMDYIPPDGHLHIPLLIEVIPSPDEPKSPFAPYDQPKRIRCGSLEEPF